MTDFVDMEYSLKGDDVVKILDFTGKLYYMARCPDIPKDTEAVLIDMNEWVQRNMRSDNT